MIAILHFFQYGNRQKKKTLDAPTKFSRNMRGNLKMSRGLITSALSIALFCTVQSTCAMQINQESSQNSIDPALHEPYEDQATADLQSADPTGLADWPALFQALNRTANKSGRIVSFRELWDAKPNELSEPLMINGRVIRRFRREPIGQFPALQELWIRTDDDGLIVATIKASPSANDRSSDDPAKPGSDVVLTGYYLRKVQYEAADSSRIAPWIVAREIHLQHNGTILEDRILGEKGIESWTLLIIVVATSAAALRLIVVILHRQFRR